MSDFVFVGLRYGAYFTTGTCAQFPGNAVQYCGAVQIRDRPHLTLASILGPIRRGAAPFISREAKLEHTRYAICCSLDFAITHTHATARGVSELSSRVSRALRFANLAAHEGYGAH